MARKKTAKKKRAVEAYEHKDKRRANNPPVGLVTPDTDPDAGKKKTYAYDPHLDPQLQWAGKAEHTAFEIPTVSLHVHERINPRSIIEAVKKRNGDKADPQMSLFDQLEENPPLREAIEFYGHAHGWSNRMVAGDSLLVMNSLLEKEGMAGKVQMVYIDPPYGIKYGSNFQPFVNKRDVKDGKDDDLTTEPEQIRAFRDTWELGIHSYLTYLRDRLLLARELLTESGSIFVQISDENVHHVRELMDEVFGVGNFVGLVPFRKKTMPFGTVALEQMNDFLLFYTKSKSAMKYNRLFVPKDVRGDQDWVWYLDSAGKQHQMSEEQHETHFGIPEGSRIFRLKSLEPSGPMAAGMFDYEFQGEIRTHPKNGYGTTPEGMMILEKQSRLQLKGNLVNYRLFLDDYPISALLALWSDTVGADNKRYAVQTNTEVVKRCLLMTTDPGDLVFDPTCGSGTTAFVAEQWGRRWITCDTSRVALTLARQRLMTAVFDYYELAHPEEGVGSGFNYKTVPHITLKSIANNEPPGTETLYDQPKPDNKKRRVSGPFTVEAVPAPAVKSLDDVAQASSPARTAAVSAVSAKCEEGGSAGGDACGTLYSGWHDRGYLPHLKAEGGTYFVTFRLADTLPKEVLERYRFDREDIVKRAKAAGRKLSGNEEKRLAKLHSARIESYLDAGHGKCWLKEPEIGVMVSDALRHFDGERYSLHAWVVMPNHVHAVVTPHEGHTLSEVLQSWKSFTSHHVQKVAQASRLQIPKGKAFWQRESYDHLVRDEADFARVCEYTIQNPVAAGLCGKSEEWPYVGVAHASSPALSEEEIEECRRDACATFTADATVARSGETLRQSDWRDELQRSGIRGKAKQHIRFARLEPLPGCRWLHADGQTRDDNAKRIVISFGPEHAPLEQRQVAHAIEEAQTLVPKPKLIVFAAFRFDPEAAKDIHETNWPGVTLLTAEMNNDLLTDDLKKKRSSNESFWLIGQPDVELRKVAQASSPASKSEETNKQAGEDACATLYQVTVRGFDYYNTKTGGIDSGGSDRIAVWMLDTDYDGRSLYPRQVFFPMAGAKEGWARLAKNLKAEIDEDLIEAYRGSVSLPFDPGEHRRIAVKIVDDRGIESLKIMEVE